MTLNATQLRHCSAEQLQAVASKLQRRELYFILEDIYDTYNVGGLFRLADALAVKKIYLCGETETPPNPKIKKASVGTFQIVPWSYKKTARAAVKELREQVVKIQVVALEQAANSKNYAKPNYKLPLAIIVGNENRGIKKASLKLADQIVELPMFGLNKSLNVIVATAALGYHLARELRFEKE